MIVRSRAAAREEERHFPQAQLFPQLHSLPLFIGQFLLVFLQFGFSAAKVAVQMTAARSEKRIFV
jgi:hypothetical protein